MAERHASRVPAGTAGWIPIMFNVLSRLHGRAVARAGAPCPGGSGAHLVRTARGAAAGVARHRAQRCAVAPQRLFGIHIIKLREPSTGWHTLGT